MFDILLTVSWYMKTWLILCMERESVNEREKERERERERGYTDDSSYWLVSTQYEYLQSSNYFIVVMELL